MQTEKIEAWFVSPSSIEYFGVESTAFVCQQIHTQKSLVRWTAKYAFSISETIKIAVGSSVFMLCY